MNFCDLVKFLSFKVVVCLASDILKGKGDMVTQSMYLLQFFALLVELRSQSQFASTIRVILFNSSVEQFFLSYPLK